ncbi:MAG: SMC-Scp complex subunit ScpB [Clostridia bacterium]|nr:SMC-Scp complex subunit ScpB [Clostridia bacterium]
MTETNEFREGSLKGRIEAVLYVAGDAIPVNELARALKLDRAALEQALRELRDEYDYEQRGWSLRLFGEHVQLATRPLYAEDVVRLLQPVQRQSLSQAIMETLAIIAYRQPVTKAEIEQVRGVKCDYSVQSLTNKGLIEEVGRKEALGRPILYGTTDKFLSHFGISSLDDLPPLPEPPRDGQDEEDAGGELVP